MSGRPLDLICVGRCMVDLYCDQIGSPIAEAQSLSMYIGGCPTNVAVGSSRQGLKVAMLTRVGDDATGAFVVGTFDREGIDTSHIRRDPERMTPMVVAGIEPPGNFPLTWYRERSADLGITAEDFDDAFVGSATAVLISGNSLSTEASARMVAALVETARRTGTRIVYDIDYRPVLWQKLSPGRSAADIAATLQTILSAVDLLVGTEDEYEALMDLPSAEVAFKQARQKVPGTAVMKLGKLGALVAEPNGAAIHHPGFPVEVYNTLGAGDAFLSGFLAAWLQDKDSKACARQANASGALVVTRHGCAPAMPYATEIDHFLNQSVPRRIPPRQDAVLEHLHASGSQRRLPRPLLMIGLDEWIHAQCGTDLEELGHSFRRLALNAVPDDGPATGFVLDVWTERALLMELGATAPLVLESLSRSGQYPLSLHGPGGDPALALRERPRRVGAKVTVEVSSLETEGVRIHQLALLKQIQSACQTWDRPWVLELGGRNQPGTAWVASDLADFVQSGIAPRCWELPWPASAGEWTHWSKTVQPLLTSPILLQAPDGASGSPPWDLFSDPQFAGITLGPNQLRPALTAWLEGQSERHVERLILAAVEPLRQWLSGVPAARS